MEGGWMEGARRRRRRRKRRIGMGEEDEWSESDGDTFSPKYRSTDLSRSWGYPVRGTRLTSPTPVHSEHHSGALVATAGFALAAIGCYLLLSAPGGYTRLLYETAGLHQNYPSVEHRVKRGEIRSILIFPLLSPVFLLAPFLILGIVIPVLPSSCVSCGLPHFFTPHRFTRAALLPLSPTCLSLRSVGSR
eukprot:4362562-Pyramimonas_sp.AAC.1